MKGFRLSTWRLAIAASLLSVGLLAGTHSASAQLGPCRSDPIVTLSDGTIVDLGANIGDDVSDVQSVTYTLHGPAHTFILLVVPTDGLVGLKEKFVYYADDKAQTYDSYTTVSTGTRGISVTATSAIVSLPSLALQSSTGYNAQALHIHMPVWSLLGSLGL